MKSLERRAEVSHCTCIKEKETAGKIAFELQGWLCNTSDRSRISQMGGGLQHHCGFQPINWPFFQKFMKMKGFWSPLNTKIEDPFTLKQSNICLC